MISTYTFEISNYDGFSQSGIIYSTSTFSAEEMLKTIEENFQKKYGEGIIFSSLQKVEKRNPDYIIVETHYDPNKNSGILVNHNK